MDAWAKPAVLNPGGADAGNGGFWTPKAMMMDPPTNLTVLMASRDAFERTVCSNIPTIENTKVNPRTKNAEFRNTSSPLLSWANGKSPVHAVVPTTILIRLQRDFGSVDEEPVDDGSYP